MKCLMTIPGIFADQNDPDAWFRQFAAAYSEKPNQVGFPYSYFAGVVGADMSVDPMADEVANLLIRDAAIDEADYIDVVTHSHGAAILLASLSRHKEARIRRWIGIASAVDCDCEKNGINAAIASGQVESIVLCQSLNDLVLAGPGMLPGYGQLGLFGPSNLAYPVFINIQEFACDHSGYFQGEDLRRVCQIVGI